MMAAAAWLLLIRSADVGLSALTGPRGLRSARWLFALALLPVALGHFFYLKETTAMVPPWLPWRQTLALLTGAGSFAAGLALLLGFQTRLASMLETAMLVLITLLVWTPLLTPQVPGLPADLQFKITGFLMSTAIAAAAWVVADSYADSHPGVRQGPASP